jgi:predicted AAA+ superfamily ATPase
MTTYHRVLDIAAEAAKRSIFLFGPRQTGKSHLLRRVFPGAPYYNLLLADQFARLSANPGLIREELSAGVDPAHSPVIVDEVQKLPLLLDEVHNLIEQHGYRFVLTGSSSRKLKRGGANLLAGRAWVRHLHPLVFPEVPDMDLLRVLNHGALPSVYLSEYPQADLQAYCGTYLKEEIQAEAVTRRIENFSRFLRVAAMANADLLNAESVARDCSVPPRTVREYFHVLEDTLIGTMLAPYGQTVRRKPVATSKFYLFDVGVGNELAGRRGIERGNELFGKCFEHFIFTELRAWIDYTQDPRPLTFWRDVQGHEVDFVIGDDIAIEVKGTGSVHPGSLTGLRMLSEEVALHHKLVVSMDPAPRRIDDVTVLPWRDFLTRLWSGAYR